MARKLLIPITAAVAGALFATSPALAATTDCAGLQQALDDATDGATVTLAAGSVCTDSYSLPSGTDLVLEGGGAGATLAGDGESQLLDGFDVGEVVIRNLHFDGGRTAGSGAAIFIAGYDAITIEDNAFTDNDSRSSGGAVAIQQGFQNLDASAEREAQGDEGSGGVTIAGNVFGGDDGNRADDDGGALSVDVPDTVVLTDNVFAGNDAGARGGGAMIAFCRDATVAGNRFEDNTVESLGGFKGSSVTSGGYAAGGGLWIGRSFCFSPSPERTAQGLPPVDSAVEQAGNDFRANGLATGDDGDGEGGGEFVSNVTLDSTDDVFHANAIGDGTNGRGGGLFVQSASDTVLRNFVATANTIQGGDGGGVRYGGRTTTLSLVHATIANNAIGEGEGSAVWGQSAQTLLIDNSIVHGNTGGPELSGFESEELARGAMGAVPGGIEVNFSLVCTADGKARDGERNLCADPKLANAAGGDVHQTAASPTHDKASKDLSGGLTKDYEGDGRFLNYDRANGDEPDMGADEAAAPPAAAAQQPKPAPAATGGVLRTQPRSCTSRRTFKIKLRNRGQKVVKATVIVNGKRVKVLRGKRLTSRVDLRGLPKGRFSVRIKLKLANGKTISGVRRYYTCRPGRRSGPPKV